MFIGKSTQSLDEKCQLTLPSNYREGLGEGVYATRGFDRNLILLSRQAFERVLSHISTNSITDPVTRLFNRLFLGSAIEVSIDKGGKIELPQTLCDYAGLEKDIVIIGQGEYFEIWSPAFWQKQMDELNKLEVNTSRFEKISLPLI